MQGISGTRSQKPSTFSHFSNEDSRVHGQLLEQSGNDLWQVTPRVWPFTQWVAEELHHSKSPGAIQHDEWIERKSRNLWISKFKIFLHKYYTVHVGLLNTQSKTTKPSGVTVLVWNYMYIYMIKPHNNKYVETNKQTMENKASQPFKKDCREIDNNNVAMSIHHMV